MVFDDVDYYRLREICQWLEDNIGYELTRDHDAITGVGWTIKYDYGDFSIHILRYEVIIDDPRFETLFALRWS